MTAMTISALTSSKPAANKLHKLWADVEKKQQRNERYKAKLDEFYNTFKQQVAAEEQGVCVATQDWILHLISFIPRKSIKGEKREALYDWIAEEIDILEANPFNPIKISTLREAFSQGLVKQPEHNIDDIPMEQVDQLRDELSDMFGETLPISDEEFKQLLKEPAKFQEFIEDLLRQREQAWAEELGDDVDDFEFEWDDPFAESEYFDKGVTNDDAAKAGSLFGAKQMVKLYRQLAKILHPDRELDSAKKTEKKALMQQLSQAKKAKDPLALLLLAQQHLPEHNLELDSKLIKQLEAALRNKISLLNDEHKQMQHGGSIESRIWQKFGGGSKASREHTLDDYRHALLVETQELNSKRLKTTSVKALNILLNQRMQRKLFAHTLFESDEFNLFDMFD
ncbi:molecular chaperone DnaJ [Motilimonas sp. KMU-193]|uniref:molecular chaperone DnaJ n=1 Tax=Motilimonas sp. KMU-193 TaxID=3388668 RepID=UPI00396B211F